MSHRYLNPFRRSIGVCVVALISLAGVTVGVTTMIVVISVMNGFSSFLIEKIIGSQSHLVVDIHMATQNWDFSTLNREIMKVSDGQIIGAAPVILGQALLRTERYGYGAQIKGIDPHYEARVTDVSQSVIAGSLEVLEEEIETGGAGQAEPLESLPLSERFDHQRYPGIALGKELGKKLFHDELRRFMVHRNVKVLRKEDEKEFLEKHILGRRVLIVSPLQERTPAGGSRMRQRWTRVEAVFETGMFDYDDVYAFVSLPVARYLYIPHGGDFSRIEIKTTDPEKAEEVVQRLKDHLWKILRGGYEIRAWMEFNPNLFRAIQIEKAAMFVILAITIVLATFSVMATLIMMAMEKTQEIGILRAVGARRSSVVWIFLFCGLIVGLLGTALGCALGLSICLFLQHYGLSLPGGGSVYYIDTLPVQIRAFDVVLVSVITIAACVAAAAFPALAAARLVPVEAIRYE